MAGEGSTDEAHGWTTCNLTGVVCSALKLCSSSMAANYGLVSRLTSFRSGDVLVSDRCMDIPVPPHPLEEVDWLYYRYYYDYMI